MLRAKLLLSAGVLLLLAPHAFPDDLPAADAPAAPSGLVVDLDTVLRLTFERNADIVTARERVNESQIAYNAALASCMPEALRKDTFKTPLAEVTLWRRRVDLSKTQNDILQDASNSYFDWLAVQRGEEVASDLLQREEKLLEQARKFAKTDPPVQVVVEAIETAVSGRRQYILHTHQKSEALAAKLTYLMGMNGAVLTPAHALQPVHRIDTSVSVEGLVRQAQENGPSVRELQGLIGAIQHGIDQACHAQRRCAHTGAPLVCARLQMAQSGLQQAQSGLYSVQVKLRAAVEDAFSAALSGRQEIDLAAKAIDHAEETYRYMNKRLPPNIDPRKASENKAYDGVLNSIRQLSQARSNHVTAVSDYDKAQARLLLLLGAYNTCAAPHPPG
jgi:outer membrane protein TolC